MKKIEKISNLAAKLQDYIKSIRDDIYVAYVLKSFDDVFSEYGDIYIFSKSALEKMKELSISFAQTLSREDLDKLLLLKDTENIIGLSTSFANGYQYGCIGENLARYNAASKKFQYYITGKYSGVSDLDLNDFFVFDKNDIDTSVPTKDDTYFPIGGTVSNFVTVEDFIKNLFVEKAETKEPEKETKEAETAGLDKKEVFKVELSKISSEEIRNHVRNLLQESHDLNFTKPSSSTGKYHPEHDNGEKGLIRHTKAVVRFAQELMRSRPLYDNSRVADLVYAACILHDMDKYNDEYPEHTNPNHPFSMMEKVINYTDSLGSRTKLSVRTALYKIAGYIGSHHGRWNEVKSYADGKPKITGYLPYPADEPAWIVHEADLMASRSFIHINFDANNDIIG